MTSNDEELPGYLNKTIYSDIDIICGVLANNDIVVRT